MKLKIRMMAAFMALVLGTSAFSTPAFAYTGEAEKQVTENSSALAESKEVETEKKETPVIDREKPEKKDETTFSVEGFWWADGCGTGSSAKTCRICTEKAARRESGNSWRKKCF